MRKTKIGRMIILVLAVVTVFAFSTTAFAYSAYTTISASSSTTSTKLSNKISGYDAWSVAGSYFTSWNDSVKLTVRPYATGSSTKLSDAFTYSPNVETGGRGYWDDHGNVDVRANSTINGNLCGVTGTWWF